MGCERRLGEIVRGGRDVSRGEGGDVRMVEGRGVGWVEVNNRCEGSGGKLKARGRRRGRKSGKSRKGERGMKSEGI